MISSNTLRTTVADLPPAYFALVMATGIVSLAADLLGFWPIAVGLFWLNLVFYAVLWMLTLARILWFPGRLVADVGDLRRGAGYLTTVAGTCILGSQLVILRGAYGASFVLLLLGFGLWAFLIYAIYTTFAIGAHKPSLRDGINGTWLLATVSTQSVSVLAGRLMHQFPQQEELIAFLALCMFFVGCVLYLIIITLIFYRFMFFDLAPGEWSAPYWINMGAVAITTLAGAILTENGLGSRLLAPLLPFITGLTLLFWSIATWWIPLLIVLTVWRHLIGRVKFTYSPEYWSMVFPLGMYTTCTVVLARALNLDFLLEIPRWFVYLAFLAWALTFAGLVKSIFRSFFTSSDETSAPHSTA
ncbi:MAG: tellurite resistance/C4-dicarboxylate transporter family protein [Desulfomonile tiedjei]|nr:tellurite resistance/C4-dicarboxylate transporter family protein [Desulfomonile tiedjei]